MEKIKIYNIMKYLISYGKVNNIHNAKYKTWQQKFLWFLNFYYTQQKKEQLFIEDFYAFNFGPVNQEILYLQYSAEENEEIFFRNYYQKSTGGILLEKDIELDEHNEENSSSKIQFILETRNNDDIKQKFIDEFDNEKWEFFEKIFELCKYKTPGLLVSLSHEQNLWKNKISLSQEERKISLEDILNEKTNPLNFLGEQNVK